MVVREPTVGIIGVRTHAAADKRYIRRCPAVKLAASRRARATGWARRLRASIHTRSGISAEGVPCGTRCLSRCLKLLRNPRMVTPNQKGSASLRVKDR